MPRNLFNKWQNAAAALTIAAAISCAQQPRTVFAPLPSTIQVDPLREEGGILPVNQIVQAAGKQVELPGLRPQVLALSPDGRLLVTSGKTAEIVVINPQTAAIRQRVTLPTEGSAAQTESVSSHLLKPDKDGQASYTGLIFSPDGRRLYLANVSGSVKVFGITEGGEIQPLASLAVPEVKGYPRAKDIPAGLAISADGLRLYVVLNMGNELLEMELPSGKTLRRFAVGNIPYGVVLSGGKAYVSNWGGRRPDETSLTGPVGIGGKVRVDPVRHIASEGSVSVIDLARGQVLKEIMCGLHASGIAASPDGRHVAIANAGSDSVSIIDTSKDRVVENISMRWAANDPFGASPNALIFSADGRRLYVCNGTQNAVAAVDFRAGHSKLKGLVGSGWFPGAIALAQDGTNAYVANIKGLGSSKRYTQGETITFNSHQYFGSVSLMPLEKIATSKTELKKWTDLVQFNYQRAAVLASQLPPRKGIAPKVVPERAGEPSLIKHAVYIIKENRTYDQVLGDISEGNGNKDLCIFGEHFTPNQHKLVKEFVLLDNAYCSGILSADGHQWADTGFATDYMEKSFAGFPRSYPDGMEDSDVDAMAYSPTGFIWDNAIAHGKTVRSFGEFAIGTSGWTDLNTKSDPSFRDYYDDLKNGTGLTRISSRPAIASLRGSLVTNTVGWDMSVPDVVRASKFIEHLKQWEKGGEMPSLTIICLPNDHTSGTKAGRPTPGALVADNDLAFGQIVEALSKSKFWKDTCVFAMEDDPQGGWDHVSGYRSTAYVASPYCKRGEVIHENYNQPSILRTIELMLGLPPMNQMDAGARPMRECFTETADLSPFTAVPNLVPLDQLNPPASAHRDPILRRDAEVSAKLNFAEIDRCPEGVLNRILWHAMKGTQTLYPSWAIHEVDDD